MFLVNKAVALVGGIFEIFRNNTCAAACCLSPSIFGYSRQLFKNSYFFLEKNNPETRELQVSFID